MTFSENVDALTLVPANVTLTGPGGDIPLSLSYNAANFTLTITPQAPLPAGASVAWKSNGITDLAGNALSPTPIHLVQYGEDLRLRAAVRGADKLAA